MVFGKKYSPSEERFRGGIVTLGLACQVLLRGILEIRESGRASLCDKECLEEFRGYLQYHCGQAGDIKPEDNFLRDYYSTLPFRNALREIGYAEVAKAQEILDGLESLMDTSTPERTRLKKADFLLGVFSKIARETALSFYNPPSNATPPGVRKIAGRL